MKRIFAIGLALVLMAAGSSFATVTRLKTLGEQFDLVKDEANIFRYPSQLLNYPKLAVGEIGHATDSAEAVGHDFQRFGVHFLLGSKKSPWVVAAYLHNSGVETPSIEYARLDHSIDFAEFFNFDDAIYPNQRMDLFWAKKIGSHPIGIHLGWVNSSQAYSQSNPDSLGGTFSIKEGLSGYKLDVGLTMNNGSTDIAVGIVLWTWTNEFFFADTSGGKHQYDQNKPDGMNLDLQARIRHFMVRENDYTLVPHGMISYQRRGIKYMYIAGTPDDPSDYTSYKNNHFQLDGGIGCNWAPVQNVLALADIGIRYAHNSDEEKALFDPASIPYKTSSTSLALFYMKLGAEAQMFNWLTVRAGAASNWDRNKYTQNIDNDPNNFPKYDRTYNYPDNKTYLGLGFLLGGWHIDSYIDPVSLLKGPYFISGESNDMNWELSILRPFE